MSRIEDYALIGDMQTAGLVGRNGSIDWLCLPRFDSGACFAALLGTSENGHWKIAPADAQPTVTRRYRPQTLVLETTFATPGGCVRLIDCMPPRHAEPDLVRVVEGVDGEVEMEMTLVIRFDYGSIVPWVRTLDGVVRAIGGPDAVSLWTPVRTRGVGLSTRASFTVRAGDRVPFVLMWHPSHVLSPKPLDAVEAIADTEAWWREWCGRYPDGDDYRDDVLRSIITIKALTYAPTGGIVAAATTSLPEWIGGGRNWDYRACWLRDATFSLYSLIQCGFLDEAAAWRSWLLRAVAGDPSQMHIMYGPGGERRLPEMTLPWLAGYEESRPVRVGNAAATQLQLDVYGEVLDALYVSRRYGVPEDPDAWGLEEHLLNHLETIWQQPDEGIWEVRGPRRHFTHSKVMAWVAFDRGIKAVERFGQPGEADRWRAQRARLRHEINQRGFDPSRNTFTQSYGSKELDASLLMLPLVGFLEPTDPRMLGTVEAIERELIDDGLVYRYQSSEAGTVDGLPAGEGVFLACSFWLADNYVLQGRRDEAVRLFERLTSLANDVGLLSEQYDPLRKRLVGNFPQAFSHVSLINTARNLTTQRGPATDRQG
jgi:GH15 family glucan-1,4-alpha-glucosidase